MFPVFHRPEKDKHVILGMKKNGDYLALEGELGKTGVVSCGIVLNCRMFPLFPQIMLSL